MKLVILCFPVQTPPFEPGILLVFDAKRAVYRVIPLSGQTTVFAQVQSCVSLTGAGGHKPAATTDSRAIAPLELSCRANTPIKYNQSQLDSHLPMLLNKRDACLGISHMRGFTKNSRKLGKASNMIWAILSFPIPWK